MTSAGASREALPWPCHIGGHSKEWTQGRRPLETAAFAVMFLIPYFTVAQSGRELMERRHKAAVQGEQGLCQVGTMYEQRWKMPMYNKIRWKKNLQWGRTAIKWGVTRKTIIQPLHERTPARSSYTCRLLYCCITAYWKLLHNKRTSTFTFVSIPHS